VHEGAQLHGQLTTLAGLPDIVDVEASGFGRGSYPIEVGVALGDGRTACFLIEPYPDWVHWTSEAEALHGITRDILLRHGQPPDHVAAALNELLAARVVYTDAWGTDSSWLALLHARTGIPASYRLETLAALLSEEQRARWGGLKQRARDDLKLNRHRASADALVLQTAYAYSTVNPAVCK
jgi:hypothetical protein